MAQNSGAILLEQMSEMATRTVDAYYLGQVSDFVEAELITWGDGRTSYRLSSVGPRSTKSWNEPGLVFQKS
jgi:hypothetical protein